LAQEAARLTVVVVFPTPPFWFIRAMTRVAAMGRVVVAWGVRAGVVVISGSVRLDATAHPWARREGKYLGREYTSGA
jgi:predicted NUDIX family NTP pyrophosphohydrolase